MGRRVIDVFLSSTAVDLADYRKAVHERLMRTGLFHCVRQEDFGAQNAGAADFCAKNARSADMFVGLIGLRRGWEPDGDNEKRSITEMEHDWARDAGRARYLWVAPDDFAVPGNTRESDELHARQMAFRKRVMGGGERIVSQKGFGSPDLLASEIVEQLMVQVVTTDLLALIRPEAAQPGQPAPSKEEQTPAIAAAVERLAEDKDVDLLALAKDPKGIDPAELEAKLMAREKELESEARSTAVKRAGYWRHIGALAFLQDTQKALTAYQKAVDLDPDDPDGLRYLGELHYRLGDVPAARKSFVQLKELGESSGDEKVQSLGLIRLCWIERNLGDLAAAEALASEGLRLALSNGWLEGQARAYNALGTIHCKRSELTRAEEMFFTALKLDEELISKEGMACAYGNLGNIYYARGDLSRAEEMQLKSLKLYEEIGVKEGIARAYSNLSNPYYSSGDLDRAEEVQLKALKFFEELENKEGIANAKGNLSLIYQARGNPDCAEEMRADALKLNTELIGKTGTASGTVARSLIFACASILLPIIVPLDLPFDDLEE